LEDAFAQKDKKETKGRLERVRMVNIENHENRFADMERGRDADGRPNWAKGEQVKWEERRFFLFGWGALG
jgi:hypothetical protein